jgi:hypothetical protein
VLRLQRAAGNRATTRILARDEAKTDYGTVQIPKVPAIKLTGGNALDWAAKKDVDKLELISEKAKHSDALEKLAKDRTRIPSLKVTTPMVDQSGKNLDYGSVEIEFVGGHVAGYSVDGKTEKWKLVDFEAVHRTTTSHKTGV